MINSLCSGKGKCGKCRIRILGYSILNDCNSLEIDQAKKNNTYLSNIKLACQIIPSTDLTISIIDFSVHQDNIFKIRDTYLNFVLKYPYSVVNKKGIHNPLGIVVDIGTTSIVVTVIDLTTGILLGADSSINPQISIGRDIVTRLTYALNSEKNREELQIKILKGIKELIIKILNMLNRPISEILEIVVIGNTVMHHLFCFAPIEKLSRAPYTPDFTELRSFPAKKFKNHKILGLPTDTIITIPPLIGGFIGSDAVVDILYTEINKSSKTSLLIDFGTNSEIILIHENEIYAASVAAGGAFEGQHIECGMRGISGAIEEFRIVNNNIEYVVISAGLPKGICGSGIIDILSELWKHKQLDYRGRLFTKDGNLTNKLILVPHNQTANNNEIFLTRRDVEAIQKAKAATMGAIRSLTYSLNIKIEEIDMVIIAGVFGSKLNIQNAKIIGLLPNLPNSKYQIQGNTAEKGGRTILLSQESRRIAIEISKLAIRKELNEIQKFQSFFTEELFFPKSPEVNKNH